MVTIVDSEKLQGYILSFAHPVGRFKAAFFRILGYSTENWEVFEQHLRDLILSQDVTSLVFHKLLYNERACQEWLFIVKLLAIH